MCGIFSKYLFLRKTLEGCFCLKQCYNSRVHKVFIAERNQSEESYYAICFPEIRIDNQIQYQQSPDSFEAAIRTDVSMLSSKEIHAQNQQQ